VRVVTLWVKQAINAKDSDTRAWGENRKAWAHKNRRNDGEDGLVRAARPENGYGRHRRQLEREQHRLLLMYCEMIKEELISYIKLT
jgi:hypothetical protein